MCPKSIPSEEKPDEEENEPNEERVVKEENAAEAKEMKGLESVLRKSIFS